MTGKHKDAPNQGLPPTPDNSLPTTPGKPDQGLPGTPDNTLPSTPGTPDNSLPPTPDNTLPTDPAHPDNALPGTPGRPDNSLPPSPDQGLPPSSGRPQPPAQPDHSLPIPPSRPDNTLPTDPDRPDNALPGQPSTPDNTLPTPPPSPDNTLPARPAGPMDPVEPVDILVMLGEAKKVEIVFSDGENEIASIAAVKVEATAFNPTSGGLKLSGVDIEITGPHNGGATEIVGYALFIDGAQVAWAARPEPLPLIPGRTYKLSDDVVFPG